ncbi:NAC domain-containing protein 35 [Mercurialis annua]|uniref:NAC domain-containing protein 35 n=1 Tax=Mercurialis annua TaxID=3986 RepID=UPI002160B844|nr:NAC domain-containing protein 35 [Mercurialis annua]
MAIAAMMSLNDGSSNNSNSNININNKEDDHEHDIIMPGFRFHPTEEELVEFYLRRKVEGKRFNVELITFLDLYRYDPWELPALAAIGEKEWFFYVPRDRKYRNGDRPNRVTTSGYWKATGADRMIRSENCRSIGLKKTLVFYSGKAPKGIRTSWIMNEYRLPHIDTERYQKAEISLCRVYKRAGVEDHPSVPRSFPTRASSSSRPSKSIELPQIHVSGGHSIQAEKISCETDGSCSSSDVTTALGLTNAYHHPITTSSLGLPPASIQEEDMFLHQSRQASPLVPNNSLYAGSSNPVDDLHTLLNYQQYYTTTTHQQQLSMMQPHTLPPTMLPSSLPAAAFSDRLWEWNPMPEETRDQYNVNNPFK